FGVAARQRAARPRPRGPSRLGRGRDRARRAVLPLGVTGAAVRSTREWAAIGRVIVARARAARGGRRAGASPLPRSSNRPGLVRPKPVRDTSTMESVPGHLAYRRL